MLKHEKPHICDIPGCSRTTGFGTVNDLNRHKKSVHKIGLTTITKSFKCAAAGCKNADKIWPRLDNFKQHTALLRTCKAIRSEARLLLFHTAKVVVEADSVWSWREARIVKGLVSRDETGVLIEALHNLFGTEALRATAQLYIEVVVSEYDIVWGWLRFDCEACNPRGFLHAAVTKAGSVSEGQGCVSSEQHLDRKSVV